ncbi:MAG TPA: glycoside-pentoside-hexuronide (GPH):cation symporter [Anaerolineales bacterium]|nr:glycoside-pentoside-hexuronide (GPH):cation symporter [Anaerolineales bacterium]
MEQKLTLSTKFRYGLADLGFALITSAMQFFLLFYYTDVAGINPAIAGLALMVGKLTWDALNDPLFGYWSDRTRSRFGRRRIYMLIGAVPLGIAAWIMFSLPKGLNGVAAFFAVLLTFWLVDTFHTMSTVPYYALTPELTRDYNERASLTSIRMVFSVFGYILGAASTTLLAGAFRGAGLNLQQAWSVTGAIFGVIVMTTTIVTTFSIKENPALAGEPSQLPAARAVLTSFKNKPFIILMIAFILSSFSFTVLTALVPYFIQYQLDMKDQVSFVLLVMLVTIGVFLVPAKLVSDRINKGPAYALGLFIASLAVIASFFFPRGATPLIYVVAAVAGMGFSAQWVFPWSMLPDVVEYDEKMTGERREGIYYGLWAFLTKFTGALGVAVSGWALQLFGYVPNAEQSVHALFGIRLFFSVVPAVVILISLPFLIWYPITRKKHAELVQELAQKKAAEGKPAN